MTSNQASFGVIAGDGGNRLTARQQFRRRPAAYAMPASSFDQKFIAFLISISGVAKSDRVVEVACGNGSTTLGFAERCAYAIGVDVIEEPLRMARMAAAERSLRNADFIVSEVERLSFEDSNFNGALCRFSFHHFTNPARVFAELARVVAPGGWMVIADMVASEDPAKAEFHNQMERLCDPTHSRTLPASEFERMFAEHNFRLALKVDRDARLTLDEWLRFGGAPPENVARLREMVATAIDEDRAGLRFTREGDQIRLVHNSVSFVLEKE
ncbi:MAG TPA: methyltransferase domain-containing protein [Candidatus Binataceae bacterium]|nr:methyltransferase domain-containing protein [Candidatus Binataceae bacterium]